ncbi:MAG: PDZ domain-containing protein [Candidatus Acidiferrum sp.]
MNKNIWITGTGTAALCAALIAAPAYTAGAKQHEMPEPQVREFSLAFGDDSGSWLGTETLDVNGERVKELKLPAERGVFIDHIQPDSPASKAGLKEKDVVTELNGQHVESALQFRRMIREIPAGRTVQLSVWRDGRAQTLNVTLGRAEAARNHMMKATPGTFAFRLPELPEVAEMPDLPEVAELPEMPSMEFNGNVMYAGHPRLGIDAEDLSGQLGSFFGAPEGEGILVRSVGNDTPAEKAGLKAGDVITSLNGERIRSVGDLRQQLSRGDERSDKNKDVKGSTVKLGVLRNKSEMSLNVELPAPGARTKRIITHRKNI